MVSFFFKSKYPLYPKNLKSVFKTNIAQPQIKQIIGAIRVLTHISLASFLWDIGKQNSPDVTSHLGLFCLLAGISSKDEIHNADMTVLHVIALILLPNEQAFRCYETKLKFSKVCFLYQNILYTKYRDAIFVQNGLSI